ncbi:MAG: T9SS type A sorting domain-containing protein [Prolixibacteraceae bacterium]
MKKLLFFITALIVLPFLSFAQEYKYVPFPDSGAIWSEAYFPETDENSPNTSTFERFALSGEDTLIHGIFYKKLFFFNNNNFNKNSSTYVGGIRENNKKSVYYIGDSIHWLKPFNDFNQWDKNKELLLYDFSLGIGDTIFEENANVFGKLIVTDIDTIQIGTTLRKKFYFNYFWVEWIEGIGSNNGLLFAASDIPTGSSFPHNDLICFLQNDTIIYHNNYYDDCLPNKLSVDNKQTNLDVTVSMNRSEKLIRFKWGNCEINRIELFNVQGTLVDVINVTTNLTEANYPNAKMQSGIYIYRATDSNGYARTGRFIVE